MPAYAAAKGALGQLTKALANEWSAHGVQVNAICPGYVASAALRIIFTGIRNKESNSGRGMNRFFAI